MMEHDEMRWMRCRVEKPRRETLSDRQVREKRWDEMG